MTVIEKGTNLTPHVFEVLAKFRSYPVGLTADIEKAFHQISVNPANRDQLRFLWFKNVKEERPDIVQYRFRRFFIWTDFEPGNSEWNNSASFITLQGTRTTSIRIAS